MKTFESFIEKLKGKFSFLDIFRFHKKGYGLKFCLLFYLLLFLSSLIFLVFIALFFYGENSSQNIEKDKILQAAISKWQTRNSTFTLKSKNFDLRLLKKNSSSNDKLTHRYPLQYMDLQAYEFPKNLQHSIFYEKHSFPTSFFILDVPPKSLGLILDDVFFSKNQNFYGKTFNESKICIEILANKGNKEKFFTIKNQNYCFENNTAITNKGISINLWKFDEIKLNDIDCNSKAECQKLCLQNNYLYFSDNFIHDKLRTNILTCAMPMIATDICFIVGYDESGYLIYHGGCYNGKNEKFTRANLEEKYEFNNTNFFIREPLDPYLVALNLEFNQFGDKFKVYELYEYSYFTLKGIFISGCVVILVIIIGILIVKTNKRFRFGERDLEMEKFNEHEMSSASIKL